MTAQGRCLRGACRFTAQTADQAGVCHCGICRKWTGGINMAVACSEGTWNADAPIRVYRSSAWAERAFCDDCGSNLFWRALSGAPSEQVVSLMAFDAPDAFPVTSQIFIDEKPDTYALAGVTVTMTGAQAMARFAAHPEGNA